MKDTTLSPSLVFSVQMSVHNKEKVLYIQYIIQGPKVSTIIIERFHCKGVLPTQAHINSCSNLKGVLLNPPNSPAPPPMRAQSSVIVIFRSRGKPYTVGARMKFPFCIGTK